MRVDDGGLGAQHQKTAERDEQRKQIKGQVGTLGCVAHPADQIGREERGDAAKGTDQGNPGSLGAVGQKRGRQLPEHW
ncbi:hypothetical protein D3C76_1695060 [compost metagenome]